jgi:serine/threonine-protein kinase
MASRHPPAAPLLGRVLAGRYRVVQLLGSGGIGDVYLGEPVGPGVSRGDARGRVAIKVLRAEHRGEPELVKRFLREAEAAARVRHGNVLGVVEAPAPREGELCFVTELLVGLDLADTLAYQRSLGPARAVKIAAGAADGLAAAHAAGVVHRDVKPENIFLVHAADGSEAVKLLDFGFAWMPGDERTHRLPGEGAVVGTPEYMAPEQAQGAPADGAADVYSLGIVLYEMLSSRVPFVGRYPEIAHLHAVQPPPPLGVPLSPALAAVVARALAKDAAARFPTMEHLSRALQAVPEAFASAGGGGAGELRRA